MHHPTDRITYHSLCYTSRGALAGTRNSSVGPPHEGSIRRPIVPWANALPLSYVPLLKMLVPSPISVLLKVLLGTLRLEEGLFQKVTWHYKRFMERTICITNHIDQNTKTCHFLNHIDYILYQNETISVLIKMLIKNALYIPQKGEEKERGERGMFNTLLWWEVPAEGIWIYTNSQWLKWNFKNI